MNIKKKIYIHFFYKFTLGGAETAFKRLVDNDLNSKRAHYVFIFNRRDISDLPKNVKDINLLQVIKLRRHSKNLSIYGWLYNGAILSFLCSFIFRKIKIVFSIQNPWRERSEIKLKNYLVNILFVVITKSHKIKKIIFPDLFSKRTHNLAGVPPQKSEVVHNGFDIELNQYDEELNLKNKDIFKLSYVGRFDEVKDIPFLIEILAFWIKDLDERNKKRIIINFWGYGLDKKNNELIDLLNKKKISKYVLLNGIETNLEKIYQNSNLLLLTSKSEGLPSVLIEASKFGIPWISTKVGAVDEIAIDGIDFIVDRKDKNNFTNKINYYSNNFFSGKFNFFIKIRKEKIDIFKNRYDIKDSINRYFLTNND